MEANVNESGLVFLTSAVPRVDSNQLTLFTVTPDQVLADEGVRLVEMQRLYEAGVLATDPAGDSPLESGGEAEMRFLATLVAAGLDLPMIRSLVADLEPPYELEIRSMVYDFSSRTWLSHRDPEVDELIDLAVEQASAKEEPAHLVALGQAALDALAERAVPPEE